MEFGRLMTIFFALISVQFVSSGVGRAETIPPDCTTGKSGQMLLSWRFDPATGKPLLAEGTKAKLFGCTDGSSQFYLKGVPHAFASREDAEKLAQAIYALSMAGIKPGDIDQHWEELKAVLAANLTAQGMAEVLGAVQGE